MIMYRGRFRYWQLAYDERVEDPQGVLIQQKRLFSSLCFFVLINNKASHIATFFSALVPHIEHWSKTSQTLILPLVMHNRNST
jgi:hypothetical protein